MKKKNNKGFLLAETLIVTIFVSGVLIFLFIQFSNLSKSYDESFSYNTLEDLYALEDVRNMILNDTDLITYIDENIDEYIYIDITDCTLLANEDYCTKLFELENIKNIFITKNFVQASSISQYDEGFNSFIKKLNEEGNQKYRLVASFNNKTYATIRFGEKDE